jgi:hypothetical protein
MVYKSITLPVVLMSVRKGHRLRALDKEVLMKIFGPNRAEVTGRWEIYNEELHKCTLLEIL